MVRLLLGSQHERTGKSFIAVCAVASLLVTGAGVSPASAKTINGCVIKAKTTCVKANLKGANLKGANLTDSSLSNAVLTGANLTGANLTGASLVGVKRFYDIYADGGIKGSPSLPKNWRLVNGYFIGPNADLDRNKNNGADLSGGNLVGANLKDAGLNNVNFSGADLTGANLKGASGTGINWTGATCPNGQPAAGSPATC